MHSQWCLWSRGVNYEGGRLGGGVVVYALRYHALLDGSSANFSTAEAFGHKYHNFSVN